MNFKKFTLTLAAMLVCVGLYAQPQSKSDESVEFRPHWDLQLQGGVGQTIGETTVGKLMSPAVVLSTNYRFLNFECPRCGPELTLLFLVQTSKIPQC